MTSRRLVLALRAKPWLRRRQRWTFYSRLSPIWLARSGEFFASVSANPAEREAYVLAQWDSILANPEATEQVFLGHPYRRWATFLRASPISELRQSNVKVFVAQGAQDRVVAQESFDALVSELAGAGRRPVAVLVPNADHSFSIAAENGTRKDGWLLILSQLLDWFLQTRHNVRCC